MRIKRSVTRFFHCPDRSGVIGGVSYFGLRHLGQSRILALEDTQAKLGIQQEKLTELQAQSRPGWNTASP